jgi:hypothetical protein
MNSGIVAMPCSVDPRSMTSNMTAIPEAATSGPPMSPSIAMPRGTKPDDTSGSQDHSVRDAREEAWPGQNARS